MEEHQWVITRGVCAVGRQALLALGEPQATGEEVLGLVAGSGGGAQLPGLAGHFAAAELRQLLEHERRAAVHALGHA
jgi:hypothetical protein